MYVQMTANIITAISLEVLYVCNWGVQNMIG